MTASADGDMSAHPDSEQLALLALEAQVAPEVRAHVQACRECQGDLSLLVSLLAAEGPDGSGVDSAVDEELADAPIEAWADASDGGAADEGVDMPRRDEAPAREGTTSGREINSRALVIVLLILVASMLLALFAFVR